MKNYVSSNLIDNEMITFEWTLWLISKCVSVAYDLQYPVACAKQQHVSQY